MTVDWYNYNHFEAELYSAYSYSSNLIVMGDLNINLEKDMPFIWQNILNSYNLTQINKNPTRTTSHSSSLIDHIYVSWVDYVHASEVLNISLREAPTCLGGRVV